jgi:hypothetical protein
MDFSQVFHLGFRTGDVGLAAYENDLARICKVKHERAPPGISISANSPKAD